MHLLPRELWRGAYWSKCGAGDLYKSLDQINLDQSYYQRSLYFSSESMLARQLKGLKPWPFRHFLSTSNFTSTLLNCFVLKTLCSKTKQLRSILVKLVVLNKCLNGWGFRFKSSLVENIQCHGLFIQFKIQALMSYHQNKDKPKPQGPLFTINSVELRIYPKDSSQLLSLILPQHESRNA